MDHPVVAPDGRVFDRAAIAAAIERGELDPKTGKPYYRAAAPVDRWPTEQDLLVLCDCCRTIKARWRANERLRSSIPTRPQQTEQFDEGMARPAAVIGSSQVGQPRPPLPRIDSAGGGPGRPAPPVTVNPHRQNRRQHPPGPDYGEMPAHRPAGAKAARP